MANEKVFSYVKWPNLAAAIKDGWIPHRSLDGTHHGVWSVLCELDTVPEEWRAIPGHAGYEVSSYGRVRSIDRLIEQLSRVGRPCQRQVKGKILKPGHCNGYEVVAVAGVHKYVANLVALAFIGPRPTGLEVAHGDGLKVNNRPGNLRYATPIENAADKIDHGTCGRGEKCWNSILTNEKVHEIRRLAVDMHISDIAREFNLSVGAIADVIKRRKWFHLPILPGEVGSPESDMQRAENIRARRAAFVARRNRMNAKPCRFARYEARDYPL